MHVDSNIINILKLQYTNNWPIIKVHECMLHYMYFIPGVFGRLEYYSQYKIPLAIVKHLMTISSRTIKENL